MNPQMPSPTYNSLNVSQMVHLQQLFFFPFTEAFFLKQIPVTSFYPCLLEYAFLKIWSLGIFIVCNLAKRIGSNLVRVNSNCLIQHMGCRKENKEHFLCLISARLSKSNSIYLGCFNIGFVNLTIDFFTFEQPQFNKTMKTFER